MANKIIIEESRESSKGLESQVVAIICQEPEDVYSNYKLSLLEMAQITKGIQNTISTIDISSSTRGIPKVRPSCRYRLDMKLMKKDDVDFYMNECDRIIKGCDPVPVYEKITDFVEVYKRNVPSIISEFKKCADINNKPLR
ncbi:MAG: hypothetical protein IKJ30_03880 [Bacilli bacterium]|nr:hypothetical protein [Bacilli bacterium]